MNILLAGDVHGAIDDLAHKVEEYKPDLVLQVGDLGLFESIDKFDSKTRKRYHRSEYEANKIIQAFSYARGKKKFPVPLWFVRGNHEDYELLKRMANPFDDDYYLWESNNFHYSDTTVLRFPPHNLKIAFLGGIFYQGNNEQKSLLPKYTQQEEIDELIDISHGKNMDILVAHDCPRNAFPDSDLKMPHGSPYVTKFIKERKPKYLIHGHYHRISRSYTVDNTKCIALGKEEVMLWQKPSDSFREK